MSLWSALTGMFLKRGTTVGFTHYITATGYTNMKNKDLLARTQDAVWASGKFMPMFQDGAETTYCNLAVQAVLNAFDCREMDNLTADAMMHVLRTSPNFQPMKLEDGQFNANLGTVIVAGLDSSQLGQSHGHVCTLTPGVAEFSGHWSKPAPQCLSIGRQGICFRSKGVNWAFVPEPELWALKTTV